MCPKKTLLSTPCNKPYSANRHDCLGFVLDRLGLSVEREALPLGWWHNSNNLINSLCRKLYAGEIKVRIKKFIFNYDDLESGDVLFMRLRGRYIHHMAIYVGNDHIEHNLPERGITKDHLRKGNKMFIFGVRLV